MSGRGAYYKEKYGGGGRGCGARGGSGDSGSGRAYGGAPSSGGSGPSSGGTKSDLVGTLRRIDNKSYPCYKDLLGVWRFEEKFGSFALYVDHVQGDAFGSPSRFRVRVPNSIPPALWSPAHCREVATRDYLTRQFAQAVRSAGGDIRAGGAGSSWHSTKGGEMHVDTPGQTILERSAVLITPDFVEARFTVALPAAGRTIVSELAHAALVEMLPRYVQSSLVYSSLDQGALKRFVESVEDSCFLRASLPGLGLVAFVADGSVLPRLSGASDKPMWPADVGSCAGSGGVGGDKAVPFVSPPSMAVTVQLPNKGTVSGMGIREGVTLITGGGFHGKTTLLKAIEQGVYDHMPGDGRELVVSVASAVKIRAEDGRCVHAVDISAFITNLPYGRRTDQFVSEDASGSTSQAANIAEALEAGAKCFVIDEDTCATNFMIRDERMRLLVNADKEPIQPFISHVRALRASCGVSTVLVVGGCGEYFDVADQVILMDNFTAVDATDKAKEISTRFASAAAGAGVGAAGGLVPFPPLRCRRLIKLLPRDTSRTYVRQSTLIEIGEERIDLTGVEQIADISQTRALADILLYFDTYICSRSGQETPSVVELLDKFEADVKSRGLDVLSPDRLYGHYALPRRYEIAAAMNRLRSSVFSTDTDAHVFSFASGGSGSVGNSKKAKH